MTETTKIQIIRETEAMALYHHYCGQANPQRAHIEIRQDGDGWIVQWDYDPEIGGAMPMDVYHGSRRWISAPVGIVPDMDLANCILDEILPLAERVVAGYSEDCDLQGRFLGHLTEDAQDAEDEIEARLSGLWDADGLVVEYDAAEYIQALTAEDLGVTATSTDADLDVIHGQIMDAREAHVYIDRYDLLDALDGMREALREDAEDID